MTALRLAAALLIVYGLWSAQGTVAQVADGGSALALSQGLIRLAGVVLLAWGIYRARAWAWWFVIAAASLAAVSGVALLVISARTAQGADVAGLAPLAVLPGLVVALLALPSAWKACRAFGRRLDAAGAPRPGH